MIVVKKGKQIVRWYYSLNDTVKLKAGETSQYYKGLGTFNTEDLEYIIKAEGGIQNMIKMLKFDNEYVKQVDDWLGDDSAPRKEYIMNNNFSIAKL